MGVPVPSEHGAWAMLYAPCILAIVVAGQFPLRAIFFLISITAFFFAHSPLFTLVRLNPGQPGSAEKFKEARIWIILYSSVATATGFLLMLQHHLWLLAAVGCVFALVLVYQTYLTARRAEKSMTGELLAVISLTAAGPATHYVIGKEWSQETTGLWILSILYFISSIFYVKMLVGRVARKANSQSIVLQCAIYHFLLLLLLLAVFRWRSLSFLVLLGYVPILLRAFWEIIFPQKKLNLLKVGLTEIAYTIVFVVFVSAGLRTG